MIKCKNSCPTGQFDGCCFECDLKEKCEEVCEMLPSECGDSIMEESGETGLQVFQQGQVAVLQQIADIVTAKKKLEEQEKDLKEKLKEAMEKCSIKKFTSDILNITYVAETTSTSVDSKKLKDKHPEIYAECSKTSKKSAYVKVEVK
jgi:predicted phage-related endonuclease